LPPSLSSLQIYQFGEPWGDFSMNINRAPRRIDTTGGFVAIACGAFHNLALNTAGWVGWGLPGVAWGGAEEGACLGQSFLACWQPLLIKPMCAAPHLLQRGVCLGHQ